MAEHSNFCQRMAEFMAEQLGLAPEDLPSLGPWSRSGLTIGALSLRLSALSLEQIDVIIDRQELTPKLFGELAVELGFLTRESVTHLLHLQKLHWALEFGELLVLESRVDLPTMVHLVAKFLESANLDED